MTGLEIDGVDLFTIAKTVARRTAMRWGEGKLKYDDMVQEGLLAAWEATKKPQYRAELPVRQRARYLTCVATSRVKDRLLLVMPPVVLAGDLKTRGTEEGEERFERSTSPHGDDLSTCLRFRRALHATRRGLDREAREGRIGTRGGLPVLLAILNGEPTAPLTGPMPQQTLQGLVARVAERLHSAMSDEGLTVDLGAIRILLTDLSR